MMELFSEVSPKWKENVFLYTDLNLEATQMSIKRWIYKLTMVCPYNVMTT